MDEYQTDAINHTQDAGVEIAARSDAIKAVEKAAELLKRGIITQAEFDRLAAKAKSIIGTDSPAEDESAAYDNDPSLSASNQDSEDGEGGCQCGGSGPVGGLRGPY